MRSLTIAPLFAVTRDQGHGTRRLGTKKAEFAVSCPWEEWRQSILRGLILDRVGLSVPQRKEVLNLFVSDHFGLLAYFRTRGETLDCLTMDHFVDPESLVLPLVDPESLVFPLVSSLAAGTPT